ncbi:MAG: 50S ribosomal protein L6 [candidate division Zixibacteria bacterium RBG_16_50_21]|nr:MAG: 50S ribosomal protein L6 [candidate division Zixibacteria bacterium RBG_16_50_21]
MSKIGNNPVAIPASVKVSLEKNKVTIQGPKGTLTHLLPSEIEIKMQDSRIEFSRRNDSNYHKALHGTSRALVANMVKGVSQGYSKELSLVGVGYRAELAGDRLTLQLGFSHPVVFVSPPGIKLDAPGGVKITVTGCDKELVGMVAAKIRSFRPPEPYKGKGIRYTEERVRKKAGKTAA